MSDLPDDYRLIVPRLHAVAREIIVEGTAWRVYEGEHLYDRRRGTMLVFESPDSARYVRQYPPNWRELSDEELHRLSRVR